MKIVMVKLTKSALKIYLQYKKNKENDFESSNDACIYEKRGKFNSIHITKMPSRSTLEITHTDKAIYQAK